MPALIGKAPLRSSIGILVVVAGAPVLFTSADRRVEAQRTDTVAPGEIKYVKVPSGTFWMGWQSEVPELRKVTIAKPFELSVFPVTQAQWVAVMGTNPSYFSRSKNGRDDIRNLTGDEVQRLPVESVSWEDVGEFLAKMNGRGKGNQWRYRLPSEAEWEYACRGAATSKAECSFDFYFAKPTLDLSSREANFNGRYPAGKGALGPNVERPTPVGQYQPNKLGLYDMHGNVWQWCEDLWLPEGVDRVIRGGCWYLDARDCRAGFRSHARASGRWSVVGFRLVRVPADGER